MPRIAEYGARVSAPGPTGGPRASGASPVAGSLQEAGQTLGQLSDAVYQRKVQRDLSQLDASIASATSDLTLELKQQAQNADPNDDGFAERFINETFESRMRDIQEAAKTREGRQFYDRNLANMRKQFSISAANYQTELAATAAKDNYLTALNSRSTAAQGDPSNFDDLLKQNAASVSVMSGLSTQQKIELRRAGQEEIAMSAAKGWIDLNPLMARQVIESGTYDKYINGEQKSQLLSQVDTALRTQDAEMKRAKQAAKDARKQASRDRFDELLPDIVTGNVSLFDIASDPAMEKEEKNTAKTWVEAATSPERNKIRTDPGTFTSLWRRIHLPDGDPDRLTDVTELDKYLGRGLTLSDVSNLRKEMTGQETPQGKIDGEIKAQWERAIRSSLSGTNQILGLRDPKGDEQVVAYMSWALPKLAEGQAEGKSLAEMLAPDGEIFKGADRFKRSINEQMLSIINSNTGNPNLDRVIAPGVPAETVPEYDTLKATMDAYNKGDISREQAVTYARSKGWVQ